MTRYLTIKNITYAFYVSMILMMVGVGASLLTLSKKYKQPSDCAAKTCSAQLDNLDKTAQIETYVVIVGIVIALLAMIALLYVNKSKLQPKKTAASVPDAAKSTKKTTAKKKTS